MATTCEQCGETRKLSMRLSQPTERQPAPIYRWECKTCGHRWEERQDG